MSFLDRFQPQGKVSADAEETPREAAGLAGLHEALVRVLNTGRYPNTPHYAFLQSRTLLEALHYSSSELTAFSAQLVTHQERIDFDFKAGVFLSAAVNACGDECVELELQSLALPLDRLAYHNTGLVTIRGDAGADLGAHMEAGSVLLCGSAGLACGKHLAGGELVVSGDAGDNLGRDMTAGHIEVRGSAGDYVGRGARGGRIEISRHAGRRAAFLISGGSVTIKGNVGDEAASEAISGQLRVEGRAGRALGARMRGGEVRVTRRIASIAETVRGGEIYQAGHRLYPAPD